MAKDEVKLFGYWASPFAIRVEWALKIKGIEYEYIDEDLINKSPMLLQYNPVHKKIPVLVHNGKPVAESLVIIEYIDETWKQNPIFPEDPYEKAQARFGLTGKGKKEARENLKTLEMGLKGKFFGGEKIGFNYQEIVGVKLVDEENMPLLNAWFDNVLDVDILKRGYHLAIKR
ncbi:hypothetical protein MKW92_030839 [Papaver armeniacum]|nr:hypothetical protein MKW92_030839 [Papaver armeniacum]